MKKKTLKEITVKNLLKKQAKIRKAKAMLGNLKVQEMVLNEQKNKERRAVYHKYKVPLKQIRAEIEAIMNFLTK